MVDHMKRKCFGYITTKMSGGKEEHKTLGINFKPGDSDSALVLARAVLQAIEHGKGVDITIYKSEPLKNGKIRITVTAPA